MKARLDSDLVTASTPRVTVAANPTLSRGLLAGALGLTLLQAAVFGWLVRIPAPLFRAPGPDSGRRPSGGDLAMVLAVDGLRDAQGWLSNPHPLISPPNQMTSRRASNPSQMELAPPGQSRSPVFLAATSAPAPLAAVIVRPPARPVDAVAPRPTSPPTQKMALTNSQVTVTGELQGRALVRPMVVGPWKGTDPLGVSRVEVSVNADGEVVLARIVESCGVKAADLQFLAACRSIRFLPLGKPALGQELGQLQRGLVILRWASPL